jgi:hypothetical protein
MGGDIERERFKSGGFVEGNVGEEGAEGRKSRRKRVRA